MPPPPSTEVDQTPRAPSGEAIRAFLWESAVTVLLSVAALFLLIHTPIRGYIESAAHSLNGSSPSLTQLATVQGQTYTISVDVEGKGFVHYAGEMENEPERSCHLRWPNLAPECPGCCDGYQDPHDWCGEGWADWTKPFDTPVEVEVAGGHPIGSGHQSFEIDDCAQTGHIFCWWESSQPGWNGHDGVVIHADETGDEGYIEVSNDITLTAVFEHQQAPPRIEIIEASVERDSIIVGLLPCTYISGDLKIELKEREESIEFHGEEERFTVYDGPAQGGVFDTSFIGQFQDANEGEKYHKVMVTWTINETEYTADANLDHAFKVLGEYNHTCYNLPIEEECDQDTHQWFSHTTGYCQHVDGCDSEDWHDKQVSSEWIDATTGGNHATGSGLAAGQIYSREQYCSDANANHYPIFRQAADGPCIACPPYTSLEVGDVAVDWQHDYLGCHDEGLVYYSSSGQPVIHAVKDTGTFATKQLDHYTGPSACFECDEPSSEDELVLKLLDDE